jgi:hypothetical protein
MRSIMDAPMMLTPTNCFILTAVLCSLCPVHVMLQSSGGFVAICPKKEVELGADKLIHRAVHAEELRQEIEFACSKAVSNQYAHLCGGALRAINPNSSMTMAEVDTCAAVFKG